MSLIKCPECENGVSEKAKICPHCGYLIASNIDEIKEGQRKGALGNFFCLIFFGILVACWLATLVPTDEEVREQSMVKEQEIYAKVIKVPEGDYSENIRLYEKLNKLNPTNKLYQSKLERYRNLLSLEKKKKKAEKKALAEQQEAEDRARAEKRAKEHKQNVEIACKNVEKYVGENYLTGTHDGNFLVNNTIWHQLSFEKKHLMIRSFGVCYGKDSRLIINFKNGMTGRDVGSWNGFDSEVY